MIRKELTADTNFDEEELQLRRLELRRESIYSQLMTVAQRTSMERRSWICLSEIADACARAPGQPEVDGARRALVIEWLRESVLQGEFEDPQTSFRHAQSRLAFLHTSPHASPRQSSVRARMGGKHGSMESLDNVFPNRVELVVTPYPMAGHYLDATR